MGRVYNRLLGTLPRSLRSRVDESVRSVLRPRVGVRPLAKEQGGVRFEPWMHGARAAVCISSDFELAWASQCVSLKRALDEGARTRKHLPALLRAFEESRVPVTWATVGHLLLEQCGRDSASGLAHPDLPRPGPYRNRYWSFDGGDWYRNDPCTSVREDPEWYAPDLLDLIAASRVPHEIGCHSFSHMDFSDANCPPDLALAELRECQEEASRRGLRLRSFVFPGNFEGNFAALQEAGFIAYRGSRGPELSYPTKEHGLWNVRGSLQLFDPNVDYSVRLTRYLDVAVRTQTCCHLSFHPSEPHPEIVSKVLVPPLSQLREREERGELWIATMGDIASYCEARAAATVRETGRMSWEVRWGMEAQAHPRVALTTSLPWAGSVPSLEIDGEEVSGPSKECFVRDGRLHLTLHHPQSSLQLRSR